MEVIEGFFLDRVHLPGHHLVVDQGIQAAAIVVAHPAGAPSAVGDDAVVRAEGAPHPLVGKLFIEPGFMNGVHGGPE